MNKKYAIGNKYPNVYFTYREAQCMKAFIQGQTCSEVGQHLAISQRTVEFYLVNMKKKLNCERKTDLINKVASSEFLDNVDF